MAENKKSGAHSDKDKLAKSDYEERLELLQIELNQLALPLSRKNRWTFLSPSSTVRNGTTTPDQAHVIDS